MLSFNKLVLRKQKARALRILQKRKARFLPSNIIRATSDAVSVTINCSISLSVARPKVHLKVSPDGKKLLFRDHQERLVQFRRQKKRRHPSFAAMAISAESINAVPAYNRRHPVDLAYKTAMRTRLAPKPEFNFNSSPIHRIRLPHNPRYHAWPTLGSVTPVRFTPLLAHDPVFIKSNQHLSTTPITADGRGNLESRWSVPLKLPEGSPNCQTVSIDAFRLPPTPPAPEIYIDEDCRPAGLDCPVSGGSVIKRAQVNSEAALGPQPTPDPVASRRPNPQSTPNNTYHSALQVQGTQDATQCWYPRRMPLSPPPSPSPASFQPIRDLDCLRLSSPYAPGSSPSSRAHQTHSGFTFQEDWVESQTQVEQPTEASHAFVLRALLHNVERYVDAMLEKRFETLTMEYTTPMQVGTSEQCRMEHLSHEIDEKLGRMKLEC